MVEFSVRIDFYRDLEGPKDYVGSALRDGLSAVVLPGVGEHVLGLGPHAWRNGPYGDPYGVVQTEVGRAAQVAKDIVEIKGVQQAEDVTGPYDVIVRAEARNLDELGKLVVARVQAIDGITRTLTCPVVRL